MKSVSGKELAKLLETRGWILMRIHGSHHIYGKPLHRPDARSPSTLRPLQLRAESSHEGSGIRNWAVSTTKFTGDEQRQNAPRRPRRPAPGDAHHHV